MKDWIFACLAPPGEGAQEALLLAKSIRHFAGSMAGNQIWALVPETGNQLEPALAAAFKSLEVCLLPFSVSEEALNFPFAAKVFAAAAAESAAEDQSSQLIWMDRGSLVLQEPIALQLPPGKVLGYRPVDHTLIGSLYDSPVDDFWALVYERCQVPEKHLFPMIASVDEKKIRPYFNAGMLVVKPERQLLRIWASNFQKLYLSASFTPFYEQDFLYRIFIHQAILAGTILATCEPNELHLLPPWINYPLHMHSDYPSDRRPQRMNDLVSCRCEAFFQDPGWKEVLVIDEPLSSWLKEERVIQ